MYPKISESRIQAAIDDAQSAASFAYPWDSLELALKNKGQDSFWLVGYGSLLSLGSAARTIDTSDRAAREPAIVYGARRQYSYRFPAAFLKKRYNKTGNFAALDSKATYKREDRFNGILTRIFLEDIPAFREREFAYDLKPVPAFRWNAPQEPYRIAYTLDCPASGPSEHHPFTADSHPLPEYHKICRDGAENVSIDFLQYFLDSTYLGDGRTSIQRWERESGFLQANFKQP
ncbi:hypothetical protein QEH56_05500 [Pelagicoccus enzymogenes]|uniref:hypothetical protein n=1 Tax=Pelagicoccus enzymogenes TaxID=2773457 RepID=UPI0028106E6E|nr:hypothetical protein [Pelagicoccus enzymogenes]MDQ8197593.1 hypothetical protein [Pelagicoccus enzymogenes]